MKLYHGSISPIEKPDINFSRNNLDFGKGFYLTSYREQAIRWAKRKALRKSATPILNIYELPDDLSMYRILRFEDDRLWIEFVCQCRRGSTDYQNYDLIIGNVADDKVYAAVDMYYRGLWDIFRTLKELKYYDANNQICIVAQKVITDSLRFIEALEV
jgi:hypothetical protein